MRSRRWLRWRSCCRCLRPCIRAGAPRAPIRSRRCGMGDPLGLRDGRRVFRPEAGELSVLRGADLTLRAGEIVALVAPSGAGKSTLLHLAGLLEKPDCGSVFFNGLDDCTLPEAQPTSI